VSTKTGTFSANAPRLRTTALVVALITAACGPVKNQPPPPPPSIRFTTEVPAAPPQMDVYKLAATHAPLDFLNEKLGAARLPALSLEKKAYVARDASQKEEHERVRAFADTATGDAHFIPNLGELVPAATQKERVPTERLQSVARAALGDERFIPRDATQMRISDPIAVMGGATAKGSSGSARTDPRVVMTMVPAFRYISDFRVYGKGSHALVTVANDGAIVGALRRWRTAALSGHVEATRKPEQVRAEIERQLRPHVPEGSNAIVDKIVLAYYDDNANYLQPVYRFEATVQPPDKKISDIRIAGYVPVGKLLEPIPDLAAKPRDASPAMPKRPEKLSSTGAFKLTPEEDALARAEIGGAGTPDDITLGEYANQDWPNDSGYVDMSYAFLNGLTFLNGLFPGLTPPVTRTQWYVAYPWEVVGPYSRYYMNAVNVAYTVPHGDWLINSTRSNCCDLWNVADIGTNGNPGYGAAAGGVLATWIIMSCEVIPAMPDRQREIGGTGNPYTAFDAWWPVFQGMHNAIGFRTIMFYPDDNLQWGFGYDASLGGDVNAAWFQEVAANDGDDGTYASGHLIGNPQVHYDRASTMIDARNLGQSIYSVGAQSAATTLWNFWMND
jgi:hypothetical protein